MFILIYIPHFTVPNDKMEFDMCSNLLNVFEMSCFFVGDEEWSGSAEAAFDVVFFVSFVQMLSAFNCFIKFISII